MDKTSKQKVALGLLLTLLSISFICASITPSVQAATPNYKEKGLNFMSDVMGLDIAKYTVVAEESTVDMRPFGGVLQECVLYNLASDKNILRVFLSFTNGNLNGLYALENSGDPIVTKIVQDTSVASAQAFLVNYQMYTGDLAYQDFSNTLNNVVADKNLTKIIGDKVLQVTTTNDSTSFKWSYTSNGVVASYTKTVSMSFEKGFLSSFFDNWDIYPIGSNVINLSEEEAVAIAVDVAKQHSWSMQLDEDTISPTNFNANTSLSWVSLSYDGSYSANVSRSENVFELYPVWRVGLVLNRVYGELYGLQVDIWADTKEIRSVNEQYSQLAEEYYSKTNDFVQPEVSQSSIRNSTMWILPPVALSMLLAVFTLIFGKNAVALSTRKNRFLKLMGVLFCILLMLVVFLPLVQTASASNVGIIWGSRSSDAVNPPYQSWRKLNSEISSASNMTSYIATNCLKAANGYTGYSNYAVDKDVILYQANYMNDNYDYVAIIDWNHGVTGKPGLVDGYDVPANEEHFMFEDDSGTIWGTYSQYISNKAYYTDYSHGVYDMDMYEIFPPSKVHFAFINTCMSANVTLQGYTAEGNPIGMSLGLTHRMVDYPRTGTEMSQFGYTYPDSFPQCYIGFKFGSAALNQSIAYDGSCTYGPSWSTWVGSFFNYAFNFDNSINDALDLASAYTWNGDCDDFSDSPLRQEFSALWPFDRNGDGIPDDDDPYDSCTLEVYGNGNIHLKNFQPSDYVMQPDISGPTSGTEGITYQFSGRSIDSHGDNIQYRFDWDDGSGYGYSGEMSNGEWGSATHSWNRGIYDVRVSAQCSDDTWSSWSDYCTITVGEPTVSFYDTHLYYGGQMNMWVYVDGDGGHQMPYESDISTTTTHDLEFYEVYGYVWVDHIDHYHGSTTTYYSNYLDDISVSDGDYFTVYYDTWSAFMMRMDDLGYDEKYIESLILDEGISPQVLNSYIKAGYNLNAVSVLLDMGFQAEAFQPIEFIQSVTWNK